MEQPLQEALRLADETGKLLDTAQAGLVTRAKRIEEAGRDNGGGAVPVVLAAGLSGIAGRSAVGPRGAIGAAKRASIRDRRKQGASDARRVLDKLKSGFFNLAEPEKARKILVAAVEKGRKDPAYAAGFLAKLGPKGLAKILDDPTQDPCVVGELVARASVARRSDGVPEFDQRFLDQALGKNKGRAAQRAASLGGCECPGATFHPVWTERLVEVLYLGPDLSSRGDTRKLFRQTADRLLPQLESGPPQGPPPGLEGETEDAVERIIAFAAGHSLDAAGRVALTDILAQPEVMTQISLRLAEVGDAGDSGAEAFAVDRAQLEKVLAELASDPRCGPRLFESAAAVARLRMEHVVARFVENPGDTPALGALRAIGGVFGALTAAPYPDSSVALNVMKAATESVKGFVKSLAGVAMKATGAGFVVTVAADAAHTVGFAFWSADADRQKAESAIRAASDERERRSVLRDSLQTDMHHMVFVSLLSDRAAVDRLGARLGPDAFPPALPEDPTLPGRIDPLLREAKVTSVGQWRDLLFNAPGNEGHLTVPDPSDRARYAAFRAWARHINPRLDTAADAMNREMLDGFRGELVDGA